MTPKTYGLITAILFTLVAISHLWRIANGVDLDLGEQAVPMIISWIGFIVTATLAFFGFKLARG